MQMCEMVEKIYLMLLIELKSESLRGEPLFWPKNSCVKFPPIREEFPILPVDITMGEVASSVSCYVFSQY